MAGLDAATSMALQHHRHGFASAVAAFAAELVSYLGREHGGPTADSAGWLAYSDLDIGAAPDDILSNVASVVALAINS